MREQELNILRKFLSSNIKLLYVFGDRGVGKSTLINLFYRKFYDEIKGDILTVSARDYYALPDSLNSKKSKLLIIDDYLSPTIDLDHRLSSPYIRNAPFIQSIINSKLHEKVIISSVDAPSFFTPELMRITQTLNLLPPPKGDLMEYLLSNYADLEPKYLELAIDLSNGNPRNLSEILAFENKNQIHDFGQIKQFINNPLSQHGLIDLNGNPLSTNSEKGKKIITDIQVINKSLFEIVSGNPSFIYQMSPRNFEEFVAELLEKEGYRVQITQATKDGGKDIMIANNSNLGNFLFYVECKRYAPDRPVGVNLVRELYGVLQADRATAGIMITSSYFSREAKEFRQNIQHQMSLKDYLDLQSWMHKFTKKYDA